MALLSTAISASARAEEELAPIAEWPIVSEELGDRAAVRLSVPMGEDLETWTVQAREERFRGMGQIVDGPAAAKLLRQKLGRACAQPTDAEPVTLDVGEHTASYVRIDCPQLWSGEGTLVIFSVAWVELGDLQTKQVVFKRMPSEAEAGMAMAFVKQSAAKVVWPPDS